MSNGERCLVSVRAMKTSKISRQDSMNQVESCLFCIDNATNVVNCTNVGNYEEGSIISDELPFN